jgi:tRNA nucleotidyltransferase/poly(A) polymerase
VPPLDPEKQRAFALEVVRTLRARGFETYWAGGCVRDSLLGRMPKDYDVATTARPEEIREAFGPRRTVPVGAQFGVMTVVGPKLAGQVEVATFRRDVAYSDGRHPDEVEFSSPEADAHRRDFTINGLFYDPVEDRVVDFVGGVDDLGRGIVRAIGEPRARFEEDKLRLLRAVRFTATFDFALDLPTRDAVEAMAAQIHVVSAERIAGEMRLMLVHSSRAAAIDLLHEVGLLKTILPELATANASGEVTATGRPADKAWLAALESLDALTDPSFSLALAALLHAFVDARGAAGIARRWKLSNAESQRTGWLLEHQSDLVGAPALKWSQLQPLLIAEGIQELIALHEALAAVAGHPADDTEYCRRRLAVPRDELDPPPLISGDDLIAHGVPRGKQYQYLLRAVRSAQLDGEISTPAEALALVERLRGGPDAQSSE